MDRALHELLAAREGPEWNGADAGQLDHVRAEKIVLAYANASNAQDGRAAVRAVLNQQSGTLPDCQIFVVSSQRFNDLKKERRFCKAGVIVLTDDTATVDDDLHEHVADLPKGVYARWAGWDRRISPQRRNLTWSVSSAVWGASSAEADTKWKARLSRIG